MKIKQQQQHIERNEQTNERMREKKINERPGKYTND